MNSVSCCQLIGHDSYCVVASMRLGPSSQVVDYEARRILCELNEARGGL